MYYKVISMMPYFISTEETKKAAFHALHNQKYSQALKYFNHLTIINNELRQTYILYCAVCEFHVNPRTEDPEDDSAFIVMNEYFNDPDVIFGVRDDIPDVADTNIFALHYAYLYLHYKDEIPEYVRQRPSIVSPHIFPNDLYMILGAVLQHQIPSLKKEITITTVGRDYSRLYEQISTKKYIDWSLFFTGVPDNTSNTYTFHTHDIRNVIIFYLLSRWYLKFKQYELFICAAKQALKEVPKDLPEIYKLNIILADVYRRNYKFKTAIKYYKEYKKHAPRSMRKGLNKLIRKQKNKLNDYIYTGLSGLSDLEE